VSDDDQTVMVLDEERKGWAQIGLAAYQAGRDDVGHAFMSASNLSPGSNMDRRRHTKLMRVYRQWRKTGEFPLLSFRLSNPRKPRAASRPPPRRRPAARATNPAYLAGRGRWGIFVQRGDDWLQFDGRDFSMKEPEPFDSARDAHKRIKQLRNRYPALRKIELHVDVIQ